MFYNVSYNVSYHSCYVSYTSPTHSLNDVPFFEAMVYYLPACGFNAAVLQ